MDNTIVITDLVKKYGPMKALKGVSMAVVAGTVHALVGQNGAGKSTMLGILAGRIAPTNGRVDVFGRELHYGDPRLSRRAGIVAIYQELTTVPALTVEANVFLAEPLRRAGFLSERAMRAEYVALCRRIGVRAFPPKTLARDLSVADQQVLEILRALVSDAKIILFDEPTASLAVAERESLFKLIRRLRQDGVTMILVSHNLDEVLDIADEITVFRDGELAVSEARKHFTKSTLVQAMIGQAGDDRLIAEMLADSEPEEVSVAGPARAPRTSTSAAPVLSASGVTLAGVIEDLDIEVQAGELVGVGGLVGSGRTSLLRALAGLEPKSHGRMWIDGKEVAWPRTVRRALSYGIALVPEDRKNQGLVMSMTAMDNIALSGFGKVARRGLISGRRIESAAAEIGKAFGLSPSRLKDPAWQLSGGNQQKLLLARCSYLAPRILLADEATRGIDVGAKAEILASLEKMAAAGLGIVLVSSELEEIAAVADRVVVLSEGRSAGCLDRENGPITTAEILRLAFQAHEAA